MNSFFLYIGYIKNFNIMHKFSKINENTNDKKLDKLDIIKEDLYNIINNTLSIESYGSARKEILMTTKIVGKEMLIEELIKFIESISNKKLLENLTNLKADIKDWESIDNIIEDVNISVKDDNEIKKVHNFIQNYKNYDNEMFLELFKSKSFKKDTIEIINKINNDNLFNEKLSLIKNKSD